MNLSEADDFTILFKVEIIREEYIPSTDPDHTICHLKGFASGLSTTDNQPPLEMVTQILTHTSMAFDGDDLAQDSYTSLFPILFAYAHATDGAGGQVPNMVAFRYTDNVDGFIKAWHNRFATVSTPAIVGSGTNTGTGTGTGDGSDTIKHQLSTLEHFEESSGRVSHKTIKIKCYVIDDDESGNTDDDYDGDDVCNWMHRYAKLGQIALKSTGSKTIITAGGGQVVLLEHPLWLEVQPLVKIHIWNVQRTCKRTGNFESTKLVDGGYQGCEVFRLSSDV